MTGRLPIGSAPSGEDTSADGTEKIPVSGSKYMLVSTIAAYIRTLTQTLTGKTINLTDNTLTGTKAQFNTALSDDNFATLTGSETLTNKTLTAPTIADFTNAAHDHGDADDGGSIAGSNAFGTIAVSGQSDVVADAAPDTLTLVAGSNVTLTTNAGTDTVTIAASGSGLANGTSFPGSPSTNDMFYRTDRGLIYYYDGTRWLTTVEYAVNLSSLDVLPPLTVTGNMGWGATDLGANGQWITRISSTNYVVTTNDGTKYWTCQLTSRDAAATAHNIGSTWTTSASAANQFVKFTTTVGAAVTAGDTHFVVGCTKTSTPGGLHTIATVFYRLIG